MGAAKKIVAGLVGVMLIATFVSGCGGDSSTSEGAPEPTEASKQFLVPGSENALVKFGAESDAAEREEASEIVEASLTARAAEDWKTQCSTFSGKLLKDYKERAEFLGVGKKCEGAIESEAETAAPRSILDNTMTGSIVALRIEGDEGYALYHGTKGKDYAIKMEKDGSEWKVASPTTEEIK